MSEEEKEVIERQKNNIEIVIFNSNGNNSNGEMYITMQDLKIILNLIEKQQKDNDILEKRLRHLFKSKIISSYDEVHKGNYIKNIDTFDKDYISKATLEEYKKELQETKKHLNSNCNIALMDFGIDLINYILEGEKDDKNK